MRVQQKPAALQPPDTAGLSPDLRRRTLLICADVRMERALAGIRDLYRDIHEYDIDACLATGVTWARFKAMLRETRQRIVEAKQAMKEAAND